MHVTGLRPSEIVAAATFMTGLRPSVVVCVAEGRGPFGAKRRYAPILIPGLRPEIYGETNANKTLWY